MGNTVIRVEGIGKKYNIASQHRTHYLTLRDVLTKRVKSFPKKFFPGKRPMVSQAQFEEFFALNDVSFEVKRGDRLGIIGRNGAGKSTLLKILSRIVEPSQGRIYLNGRVASLLEVGTGFHPELTGRENIYLNGAILGMTRLEINRKFDEIVAFAEVEKFLETPVKRYSSGMYVRLAFAVAAHLEPDILLVDEVLAVGDIGFQKKCLGKMEQATKDEGRTVLFVSHNLAAIQKLCDQVLLLQSGQLKFLGNPEECINQYLQLETGQLTNQSVYAIKRELLANTQNFGVVITNLQLLTKLGEPLTVLQTYDSFIIRFSYQVDPDYQHKSIALVISLKTQNGLEVFRLSNMPISGYPINRLDQTGYIDLIIEKLPLTAGYYWIDLSLARPNLEFIYKLEDLIFLEIQPKDVYNSGLALDQTRGLIAVQHQWRHDLKTQL